MYFSTIAAISTPHGKGGVAVLRISGAEAIEISEKVFRPKSGKGIKEYAPRFQIYGDILSASGNEIIDDGLLTYFLSPHSFTGENVVEISCHGGEIITSMVLSSILAAGAVMAKPGEFSRRAFLNGKMSLTSAEGIADLLDAKTEEAAKLSSKTSRGKLSQRISAVSDTVLSISSSLWAYLDYPEEDLQTLTDSETILLLDQTIASCDELIVSFGIGRAVNSGISCAIVGKPNVGKSTFFNALLGEKRAIVTDIPGTTRDVIEYPVKAGKVLLNLSDTAGVRGATDDRVEKIGIDKALSALNDAELIFALFDLSRPLEEDDRMVIGELEKIKDHAKIISIFTKADLAQELNCSEISFPGQSFRFSFEKDVDLSGVYDAVEKYFITDGAALREGWVLTNARQKAQLEKARELLFFAKEQVLCGSKDVASLTLEEALAALLEVDGKSAGEMILDQVFSRFCIGK